jgi:ribosomal protein S18 acetylase RimI-like enzyme
VNQERSVAGRLVLAPANQVSAAERARLINESYAGYYVPLHVTAEQVVRMDQAYDADLGRSVVAFVGAEPVGMTLLGRRDVRGWIHSVGTLPAWRRYGIARAMVAQVMAAAAEDGVEQLKLEVVTQNTPAYRLYESLDFRPHRELLTWRRTGDEEPLPIPRERLAPADPGKLYGALASWQDQPPCWQHEIESLKKLAGSFKGYRLPGDGSDSSQTAWDRLLQGKGVETSGCCLVSASDQGVSITAAAIRPGSDLLSHGRMLFQALSAAYLGQPLSMLNVPADSLLCRALAALRFRVTMRQFEMVFTLH